MATESVPRNRKALRKKTEQNRSPNAATGMVYESVLMLLAATGPWGPGLHSCCLTSPSWGGGGGVANITARIKLFFETSTPDSEPRDHYSTDTLSS